MGRQQDPRTNFTIGLGFEPEAVDNARELERLDHKTEGGADYVMTQPAFRAEPLTVLEPYRSKIPILVGVMILSSLAHAQRIGQVADVVIPDEIYQRLTTYKNSADQAKTGREIATEQMRWVRANGWAGLYVMSPDHRPVIEVLSDAFD